MATRLRITIGGVPSTRLHHLMDDGTQREQGDQTIADASDLQSRRSAAIWAIRRMRSPWPRASVFVKT